ncbi:alpha-1,4-N-acetylglucosaminyltransferase-like [Ambystoma mexicanum]|uniref:alpha-1,4-N-acetylglucosaminyltransferase-like n=1 Tax=Ambystoma mexicanum TaxID=8296 RepID=UPI0037E7FBBA
MRSAMMRKPVRIFLLIVPFVAICILYILTRKPDCWFCRPLPFKKPFRVDDVLGSGNTVFFLETSDRQQLSPMVSCAVESASRIYTDRPVVLLMEGLANLTLDDINTSHKPFSPLYSLGNVFLLPLNMDALLQDTPLYSWYREFEPSNEKQHLTVISDALRLALIWKYGGIYMDTDLISIRPIRAENFLAAEAPRYSSNAVFSFGRHNTFIWDCMNNFPDHFNASIWVNPGPILFTMRLKELCTLPLFEEVADSKCQKIAFLHPNRFFPFSFSSWRKYYEVWETYPDFSDSYALYLWKHLNNEGRSVVPGSKTLVEHLYKTYCPSTYEFLIENTLRV